MKGCSMFKCILFPTDGSTASLQAADALERLADPEGCLDVTIVTVISPVSSEESDFRTEAVEPHNAWLRSEAERIAKSVVEFLRSPSIRSTTKVLQGKPVSAVLAKEAATGRYDLIIMSSRGLGQQHDKLRYLGSVTEHVIRRVSIPVLVVPVKYEDEED
jgi:nucleotide-binding universal stress UspA family protein